MFRPDFSGRQLSSMLWDHFSGQQKRLKDLEVREEAQLLGGAGTARKPIDVATSVEIREFEPGMYLTEREV